MALSNTDKISYLFKKLLGKSSTNNSREFFEEPRNGRQIIVADEIWAESDSIPDTAPSLSDGATSGVVKYFQDKTLTAVSGVSNSFYHADLVDAIPFNFGDGTSYNYTLKDSGGSAIAFGQGDWIVDPATGTLTFYGTVPANMPPQISFYKYVGTKGTSSYSPNWTKYTATHTDFSAASTTNDVSLFSLAADEVIHGYILNVTEVFSGGSIGSYDVKIGVGGDLDKHVYNLSVVGASTEYYNVKAIESISSSTDIRVGAEADVNLDEATQGSVDIYVLKSKLP